MISSVTATLLLSLAVAAPPSGQAGREPELRRFRHLKVIALDPGHGGHNTGCLGVDGTWEKTLVLQIARRVERILLEETNAVPLLTRRDDAFLGLRERTEMANAWGADVFLSLHLNADPYARGKGVEAWFLATDAASVEADKVVAREEAGYAEAESLADWERQRVDVIVHDAVMRKAQADSEVLAHAVAASLWKHTRSLYRGVKQARFGVLKAAQMPAIVVESGFFSHREEGWNLLKPEYQDKVARAIVDGLLEFDAQIGGVQLGQR